MSREDFLKKPLKNKSYRLLLLCLLSFLVLNLISLFYGIEAFAGQATLSWVAPSINEDGTPLTDLAGYKIYYGTASGNYTNNVDAGNVTTYAFTNLTDGKTFYFVATAYNAARVESSYSNEISKTIPALTQTYTLSVNKAGTGAGMVTSSPAGISCGSDCSEVYTSGTLVTLTAVPDNSSSFGGWSGACTGTGTCSVTMNGAKNVTATFNLKTYTITASAGSGGSISPSGTLTVNYGGSQNFTITPNANYTVGNVVVDGSNAGSVTNYNFANVTGNHTISASFTTIQQNSLNVTKAGTGTGMVTSSPAGISCGSDCSEVYTSGTLVTLTAVPDNSSSFGGWSGACTGTGTCSVTMNGAKSVTATFNLKTYTITASAGSGGSISPSGTLTVNYGGSQNFTITPNANYTVGNVVVDGSNAGSVTNYNFANVTGNHTISASFTTIQQNSLNVTKAGTGTGMVTSSPAGISCGSDCSEVYTSGTLVTLTAVPDNSSSFGGWSGACTGTGTCSVTMNGAKSVTATFNLKTYTITASAGSGGSISPSGTLTVNYGGSQNFTITPNANYTVGNVVVDGSNAGSVTNYNFANVTGNHTISASFTTIQQNSLNVTKAGTGTGMVTSSPAGISCGSDCSEVYTSGTLVTLTAVPDNSSSFGGWSGACTGTGICSVTMDAAKSVSPLFQANSLTITVSAGNGGSISPSGTLTVNYGGSQNFTIRPNANYRVGNVVVDGSNAGSVTNYNFANVTGNHTISASFTEGNNNDSTTEISKTGQIMTYAMGDDGNIQAGVEWPAQRFTDNGDGTVTDNLTGLMWLKDGGCFKNSLGSALNTIEGLNNHTGRNTCLGYTADYTDWRLPTANELKSLVNYGTSNSSGWLNSEGFTNMKSSHYWSATTSPGNASKAWMVNMYNGTEKLGAKNNVYMLPVRIATSVNASKSGRAVIYTPTDGSYIKENVEWPAPRFTDNGDGTVTDSLTGLMWLKDAGCLKKSWSDTLNIIAEFNSNPLSSSCLGYTANYTDWRIPNVKELESMINYDVSDSAGWLNSAGFTNVKYSSYWSSTTSQKSAAQAWMINMQKSTKLLKNKKSTYYAWPVRGGNVDGN